MDVDLLSSQQANCKVVEQSISGMGKTPQIDGVVRNLTRSEFVNSRVDLCLRLDKDYFLNQRKNERDAKRPLILSLRFRSIIFHLAVERAAVRISTRKQEIMCKLQQVGALKHVNQLIPFMDKLFVFIREVVANKNWIERELTSREIEADLSFRDFIVYPSVEQSIVIVKAEKVGNKRLLKYLSIAIDVEKIQLVVWRDDVCTTTFTSFNAILMHFLEVDQSKSFRVAQILGYDYAEFKKKVIGELKDLTLTQGLALEKKHCTEIKLSSKDKRMLMYDISVFDKNYYEDENENKQIMAYPVMIAHSLRIVLNSVTEHQSDDSERLEWVKAGAFVTFLRLFGNLSEFHSSLYDIPLRICTILLSNSLVNCKHFYKSFFSIMYDFLFAKSLINCAGVVHALSVLMVNVHPLPEVFQKESGLQRLVDVYKQMCQQENRLIIHSSFVERKDLPNTNLILKYQDGSFEASQTEKSRMSMAGDVSEMSETDQGRSEVDSSLKTRGDGTGTERRQRKPALTRKKSLGSLVNLLPVGVTSPRPTTDKKPSSPRKDKEPHEVHFDDGVMTASSQDKRKPSQDGEHSYSSSKFDASRREGTGDSRQDSSHSFNQGVLDQASPRRREELIHSSKFDRKRETSPRDSSRGKKRNNLPANSVSSSSPLLNGQQYARESQPQSPSHHAPMMSNSTPSLSLLLVESSPPTTGSGSGTKQDGIMSEPPFSRSRTFSGAGSGDNNTTNTEESQSHTVEREGRERDHAANATEGRGGESCGSERELTPGRTNSIQEYRNRRALESEIPNLGGQPMRKSSVTRIRGHVSVHSGDAAMSMSLASSPEELTGTLAGHPTAISRVASQASLSVPTGHAQLTSSSGSIGMMVGSSSIVHNHNIVHQNQSSHSGQTLQAPVESSGSSHSPSPQHSSPPHISPVHSTSADLSHPNSTTTTTAPTNSAFTPAPSKVTQSPNANLLQSPEVKLVQKQETVRMRGRSGSLGIPMKPKSSGDKSDKSDKDGTNLTTSPSGRERPTREKTEGKKYNSLRSQTKHEIKDALDLSNPLSMLGIGHSHSDKEKEKEKEREKEREREREREREQLEADPRESRESSRAIGLERSASTVKFDLHSVVEVTLNPHATITFKDEKQSDVSNGGLATPPNSAVNTIDRTRVDGAATDRRDRPMNKSSESPGSSSRKYQSLTRSRRGLDEDGERERSDDRSGGSRSERSERSERESHRGSHARPHPRDRGERNRSAATSGNETPGEKEKEGGVALVAEERYPSHSSISPRTLAKERSSDHSPHARDRDHSDASSTSSVSFNIPSNTIIGNRSTGEQQQSGSPPTAHNSLTWSESSVSSQSSSIPTSPEGSATGGRRGERPGGSNSNKVESPTASARKYPSLTRSQHRKDLKDVITSSDGDVSKIISERREERERSAERKEREQGLLSENRQERAERGFSGGVGLIPSPRAQHGSATVIGRRPTGDKSTEKSESENKTADATSNDLVDPVSISVVEIANGAPRKGSKSKHKMPVSDEPAQATIASFLDADVVEAISSVVIGLTPTITTSDPVSPTSDPVSPTTSTSPTQVSPRKTHHLQTPPQQPQVISLEIVVPCDVSPTAVLSPATRSPTSLSPSQQFSSPSADLSVDSTSVSLKDSSGSLKLSDPSVAGNMSHSRLTPSTSPFALSPRSQAGSLPAQLGIDRLSLPPSLSATPSSSQPTTPHGTSSSVASHATSGGSGSTTQDPSGPVPSPVTTPIKLKASSEPQIVQAIKTIPVVRRKSISRHEAALQVQQFQQERTSNPVSPTTSASNPFPDDTHSPPTEPSSTPSLLASSDSTAKPYSHTQSPTSNIIIPRKNSTSLKSPYSPRSKFTKQPPQASANANASGGGAGDQFLSDGSGQFSRSSSRDISDQPRDAPLGERDRDGNISASPNSYSSPVLSLSQKLNRSDSNHPTNSPSLSREGSVGNIHSLSKKEQSTPNPMPLQVQLSPRSEKAIKRATSPRHEQRSPRGERTAGDRSERGERTRTYERTPTNNESQFRRDGSEVSSPTPLSATTNANANPSLVPNMTASGSFNMGIGAGLGIAIPPIKLGLSQSNVVGNVGSPRSDVPFMPKLNFGDATGVRLDPSTAPLSPHGSMPKLSLNLQMSTSNPGITSSITKRDREERDRSDSERALVSLSKKLGEFMVFTDLNALLAFKHVHDETKERAKLERERAGPSTPVSAATNAVPTAQVVASASSDSSGVGLGGEKTLSVASPSGSLTARRNSSGFRNAAVTNALRETNQLALDTVVDASTELFADPLLSLKCDMLRIFAILTNGVMTRYSPVNLLFNEIVNLAKIQEPRFLANNVFPTLLKQVLSNFARQIEYRHSLYWNSLTSSMGEARKKQYRLKGDIFLWRLHARLISACTIEDIDDIATLLNVLGTYVTTSRTRVMANQVVDVCFKTILMIKSFLFNESVDSLRTNMSRALLFDALIFVLTAIIARNGYQPLDDMLLTILFTKEDSFTFLKRYAVMVYTSGEFNAKLREEKGEPVRIRVQCRVTNYFAALIKLICRLFPTENIQSVEAMTQKITLLKKIEFLVAPDAIFHKLISCEATPAEVKIQILVMMRKMVEIKDKEHYFMDVEYFDSYISFHYLHFLKLYHNYSIDPLTMRQIKEHLRVLTAYAFVKNMKINQKFYQLQIMNWMCKEMDLEYEVKQLAKKEIFADPAQASSPEKSVLVTSSDALSNSTSGLAASQSVSVAPTAVQTPSAATSPQPATGNPKAFAFNAVIPGLNLGGPVIPTITTPAPTNAATSTNATPTQGAPKPFSFNAIIPGLNIATSSTSTAPKSAKEGSTRPQQVVIPRKPGESFFSSNDDTTTTTTTTSSTGTDSDSDETSSAEKDGAKSSAAKSKEANVSTGGGGGAVNEVFRSPFALNLGLGGASKPAGTVAPQTSTYVAKKGNNANSLFAFTDSTTSTGSSGTGSDSDDTNSASTTTGSSSTGGDDARSKAEPGKPLAMGLPGIVALPLKLNMGLPGANPPPSTVTGPSSVAIPPISVAIPSVVMPGLSLNLGEKQPTTNPAQPPKLNLLNPGNTTQSSYKPKTATKGSLFAFSSSETDSSESDSESDGGASSTSSSSHSRSRSNSGEEKRERDAKDSAKPIGKIALPSALPTLPPLAITQSATTALTTTTTTAPVVPSLSMPSLPPVISPLKLSLGVAREMSDAGSQSLPLQGPPSPTPALSPKATSLPQPVSPHGTAPNAMPRIGSIRRSQTNALASVSSSNRNSSVGTKESSSANLTSTNSNGHLSNATPSNPALSSSGSVLQPKSSPLRRDSVTTPKLPQGLNVKLALNLSAPSLPSLNLAKPETPTSLSQSHQVLSTPQQLPLVPPVNLALGGGGLGKSKDTGAKPEPSQTAPKTQAKKNSLFAFSSSEDSSSDSDSDSSDTSDSDDSNSETEEPKTPVKKVLSPAQKKNSLFAFSSSSDSSSDDSSSSDSDDSDSDSKSASGITEKDEKEETKPEKPATVTPQNLKPVPSITVPPVKFAPAPLPFAGLLKGILPSAANSAPPTPNTSQRELAQPAKHAKSRNATLRNSSKHATPSSPPTSPGFVIKPLALNGFGRNASADSSSKDTLSRPGSSASINASNVSSASKTDGTEEGTEDPLSFRKMQKRSAFVVGTAGPVSARKLEMSRSNLNINPASSGGGSLTSSATSLPPNAALTQSPSHPNAATPSAATSPARTGSFPTPAPNQSASTNPTKLSTATATTVAKTDAEELKEKDKEREQREKDQPEREIIDPREQAIYMNERSKRKFYGDTMLHARMVEFIIIMLIAENGCTLESRYTNQYPMRTLKMNILHILRIHLNHPSNEPILALVAHLTNRSKPTSFLFFKLFCKRFFQANYLSQFNLLGVGAYGKVFSCKLFGEEVAVKKIPVSHDITDRCVPHDIFTEILILDKWKADDRICRLIDYGCDSSFFWVVMKKYRMSLRSWREKQTRSFQDNLLLYCNVYSEVLNISRFFGDSLLNHYDIKCDNFLIDPLNAAISDEAILNQDSYTPNFKLCIADFGESYVYSENEPNFTLESRGTEFIKSPEMLTVSNAKKIERDTYDRLKAQSQIGAGPASDVWSLGCLFFELLTCHFLFQEADWAGFFIRVTAPSDAKTNPLIPAEKRKLVEDDEELLSFLRFILEQNPIYRPTLPVIINKFKTLKGQIYANKMSQVKGEGGDGLTVEPVRPRLPSRGKASIPHLNINVIKSDAATETTLHEQTSPRTRTGRSGSTAGRDLLPRGTIINKAVGKVGFNTFRRRTEKVKKSEEPGEQASAATPVVAGSLTVKLDALTTKSTTSHEAPSHTSKQTEKSGLDHLFHKHLEGSDYQAMKDEELQRKHALEQELAQINYNAMNFSQAEYDTFALFPSQITNYLYLGSPSMIENAVQDLKFKYGITHIYDCSKLYLNHNLDFFYQSMKEDSKESDTENLAHNFSHFCNFVQQAAKQRGKIFVACDQSIGPTLVIGFLLETLKMPFFEAYQYVYKKRYVIKLESKYIHQLLRLEKKKKKSVKECFECACGMNKWVLLSPFDQTEHQNPIQCNCQYQDYDSECPYVGCGQYLEEIAEKTKKPQRYRFLNWGFTHKDNVAGAFENCGQHELTDIPQAIRDQVDIKMKGWAVYICRKCLFPTYAVNNNDSDQIAVVTNIKATNA